MKTLAQVVKEKMTSDPEQLAKAIKAYYAELLPKSVATQLEALEQGKEFEYRPVIEERMAHFKGNAEEFFEDFAEESEEMLKDLEGKAKAQYKEMKSFFSSYVKKAKGGKTTQEDEIKKAKEELDKD